MVTNMHSGWCDFKIGDFSGTPSYLTDIPLDLLECFVSYFDTGAGASFFNEEHNGCFTLVLTDGDVFVIEQRGEEKLIKINADPIVLSKELLNNIYSDFHWWIGWVPCFEDMSNKEIHQRRHQLTKLCLALEDALKKHGYNFKMYEKEELEEKK